VSTRRPRISFTPLFYVGALVLLTALFFHRLVLTPDVMGRGDVLLYFTPYWHLRAEALRGAASMLWTPGVFMGAPLLANSQVGLLYPLNWLAAPFAAPYALKLSLIAHAIFAALGAFLLARVALGVTRMSALAAALLFAFSGHMGAQSEHINQFQGLAWLPWLLLILHIGMHAAGRRGFIAGALGLAGALAMQFLTGHTQTVFISLCGLGIYALALRSRRALLVLVCAGLLTAPLIAPQLVPTLELSALSVRSGGLAVNEAVSFSLSPFVLGRGLLPAYDGLLFTEYIAYIGIIGIGLAALGGLNGGVRRWPWLILCAIGLLLALGAFNPLYYLLANFPPLNLFRVPARWIVLAVLAGAMLAALGIDALRAAKVRQIGMIGVGLAMLAGLSFLAGRDGSADVFPPDARTLAGWAAALAAFAGLSWFARKRAAMFAPVAVCLLAGVELFAASLVLPYNQTVQPDALAYDRFTAGQLRVLNEDLAAPGRTLTISRLEWDTYDLAAITARYQSSGYSALSLHTDLTAAKAWDALRANLGLMAGIPTVDGFDGGLLPTAAYAAFSARLTPDGQPVADGRLREALTDDVCGGPCVPDAALLALMDVRWLILDKTSDVFADELAYDTGLPVTQAGSYANVQGFAFDSAHVLYTCPDECPAPRVTAGQTGLSADGVDEVQGYQRARYAHDPAAAAEILAVEGSAGMRIHAVTLVHARAGTFQQLAPAPFTRVLSSELKVYENALAGRVSLWRDGSPAEDGNAVVEGYAPEQVAVRVNAAQPATLVLGDAGYPGWTATVNGVRAPIHAHMGFFRAVDVPAGESEVIFSYTPWWWPVVPLLGAIAWLGWAAALAWLWWTRPPARPADAPPAPESPLGGRAPKIWRMRLRG
jgi:hypothetical protein